MAVHGMREAGFDPAGHWAMCDGHTGRLVPRDDARLVPTAATVTATDGVGTGTGRAHDVHAGGADVHERVVDHGVAGGNQSARHGSRHRRVGRTGVGRGRWDGGGPLLAAGDPASVEEQELDN